MPVQMFALAVVVGDAMSGIKFKTAGDEHVGRVLFQWYELYLVDISKNSILSFRRRPESSVFNQLDTGLRRCDEFLEVFLSDF